MGADHLMTAHDRAPRAFERARKPDVIAEIRGNGLPIGLCLMPNDRAFMAVARDHGLLFGGGGDNCVRLLPPRMLKAAEADLAVARIERTCIASGYVAAEAA